MCFLCSFIVFLFPPSLPSSLCLSFFLVHLFVYLHVCFPKGERKRRCGENGWGDEEDLGGDGKGKTMIRHTAWIFNNNSNKICHVNVHSNCNHFAKSKYSSAGSTKDESACSTKDVEIMWSTTESILEVSKGFKITYQDYYNS